MHDRVMSWHRSANDCRTEQEWEELAPKLGLTKPSEIALVWWIVMSARRSGLSSQQAFPTASEMDKITIDIERMKKAQGHDNSVGETVVTNDRVVNMVLTNAGEIIGRRDISPLDKFETLFAYMLKARREVLGAVDT